jgi:predicted CopG family antitoxin
MPSHTVAFDNGQYQYVLATKGERQSVSERVRELVDKGMEVEEDE